MCRAVAPPEGPCESLNKRLHEPLVDVLGCPCAFVAEEQMVAWQGDRAGAGARARAGARPAWGWEAVAAAEEVRLLHRVAV